MSSDKTVLDEVTTLKDTTQEGVLVIVVSTDGHTPQVPGAKMLVHADGTIKGTVGGGQIENKAVERALALLRDPNASPRVETWHLLHDLGMCCGGRMSLYMEPLRPGPRLLLFGAGHVALPTARLARESGFRVTVVDPREDWNSSHRFPTATERIVLSYEDFLSDFTPSPTDYVVIVTQGHEHDEFVLRHMVKHPLCYLGMIGSQRKISRTLRKLPPASQWNAELHAPVGLDIGAETPNEIAVAIVAELIQVRKGKDVNASKAQGSNEGAAPTLSSPVMKEIA